MKTDLATAVGVAVVGAVVAFLLCNLLVGDIEDVKYKTIDGSVTMNLAEPDENVFNYKALNPTVDAYVGNEEE